MYVDVWSDVICPYCCLGSRHLAQALEAFERARSVTVRRHAFELDPGATPNSGLSLIEVLSHKYSMSVERARAINLRLETEARNLSMEWSLENARPTNTLDAHRVIALAATQALDEKMSARLFTAYFAQGELVSDHATLERLARDVGVTGVGELWSNDDFVAHVRADEAAAENLGISGVPSFLVDERFMVVGAQGADQLLSALRRAWARRDVQSSTSKGTTAAVATE